MDWRVVAVYAAVLVAVAALLWPDGSAAKAVRSVGTALQGSLAGGGGA